MKAPAPEDEPLYETPSEDYSAPDHNDFLSSLTELGSAIVEKVDNAISNTDFSGLSTTITSSINRATSSIKSSIHTPSPYIVQSPVKATTSLLKCWVFGIIAFPFLVALICMLPLLLLSIGSYDFLDLLIVIVVSAFFAVPFTVLFFKELKHHQMLSSLKTFARIIGQKEQVSLRELSVKAAFNFKSTKQRVKNAIEQGYIPEGHLKKNTLYLTDSAYQNQKQPAPANKQKKQADSPYAKQLAQIVEQVSTYLKRIQEANNLIEEQEMSDKLFRLEKAVSGIIVAIQKDPTLIKQLNQFMNYYLPTCGKLVDAYADLDRSNAHGPTAENTRKEIKSTLDVINASFEKLADELLQDKAWDLSSDMSVLKTMLTQDGLVDSNTPHAQSSKSDLHF